jgi:lysophospholipase L1-like esterase
MSTRTGEPPRQHNNRRFKLLTVAVALTVTFAIPEILVRMLTTEQASYKAILFGGDANSPKLFVQDADLHWSLRANANIEFMGFAAITDNRGFRVAKPRFASASRPSILCVGDSTTFGWGVAGNESFPAALQQQLNGDPPAGDWVVHNAGVPGYSSFQMRQSAERWIPVLKPKFVVMCIGNNDTWPALQSDFQASQLGIAGQLARFLQTSAFFRWVASTAATDKPPKNPRHFGDDSVPRVSNEEMVHNLMAVIDLAKEHDAQPLILGAPANLRVPPRNMDAEIARHGKLGDQIYAEIMDKHVDTAIKLADDALALEPSNIYLKWLRAMVTALAVDPGKGQVELERVFELHRYPDRARGTYRARQKDFAAAAGVPFADVNQLFLDGRSADEAAAMYVDWCHPTAAGHGIMARKLAEWITRKQ